MPEDAPARSRRTYPWTKWEDGRPHAVPVPSAEAARKLGAVLRTRAARRQLQVRMRHDVRSATLTFQLVPPGVEPAPFFGDRSPHEPGAPACPTCGAPVHADTPHAEDEAASATADAADSDEARTA